MRQDGMRIGVLARRTGISVRMLHHYDQIGLLTPTARTKAAHRRYSVQDIARLQQIQSLRQLGFSLQKIKACLSSPDFTPQRVVALHLKRLREQSAQLLELINRLERLARWLNNASEVSAEEFLGTVEAMSRMEKFEHYVTPAVKAEVTAREARLGRERMQEAGTEWDQLTAALRAEMEADTDPASPQVQALARRLLAVVNELTEGYPAVTALAQAVHHDPEIQEQAASNPALGEYMHSLLAGSTGTHGHAGLSPALREYLHRVMAVAGAGFNH